MSVLSTISCRFVAGVLSFLKCCHWVIFLRRKSLSLFPSLVEICYFRVETPFTTFESRNEDSKFFTGNERVHYFFRAHLKCKKNVLSSNDNPLNNCRVTHNSCPWIQHFLVVPAAVVIPLLSLVTRSEAVPFTIFSLAFYWFSQAFRVREQFLCLIDRSPTPLNYTKMSNSFEKPRM